MFNHRAQIWNLAQRFCILTEKATRTELATLIITQVLNWRRQMLKGKCNTRYLLTITSNWTANAIKETWLKAYTVDLVNPIK